jgi:hypothetical protein
MKEPCLMRVEDADMENLLSLEEIKKLMEPKLAKLRWKPVCEDSITPERSPEDRQDALGISERDMLRSILEAVKNNPGKPLMDSISGLGERQHVWRSVKTLENIGYMALERISTGRPGSSAYYAEVTESGAKFLGLPPEEAGIKSGKNRSLKAKIFCLKLEEHFRTRNIRTAAEYGGADLALFHPEGITCYEVETAHVPHILENIRRNLHRTGAVKTVVVMATKEELLKAGEICKSKLSPDEFSRVEFRQIGEFLK